METTHVLGSQPDQAPAPQQGRWEVSISGSPRSLALLARDFAEPPLIVIPDDRQPGASAFLLLDAEFESCATADAVLSLAQRRVKILQGILRYRGHNADSLGCGPAVYRHAEGRRDVYVTLQEVVHVSAELSCTVVKADGSIVADAAAPEREFHRDMLLSISDAEVETVFRLYADLSGDDWTGLYRLHEVIEGDVGGQRAFKDGAWAPPERTKLFRWTANSRAAVGDAARHGRDSQPAPPKPMLYSEARDYIRCILRAWLATKSAGRL